MFSLGQGITLQWPVGDGTFRSYGLTTEKSAPVAANNATQLTLQADWPTGTTAGYAIVTGSDDPNDAGAWATLLVLDFADDNNHPSAPIAAPKKNSIAGPVAGYKHVRVELVSVTANKHITCVLYLNGGHG